MNIIAPQIKILLDEVLKQSSHVRKGGNELVYFCPKCNHHKKKMELCLDENKFGVFNCWVCGFRGNIYTLLKFCNAPTSLRNKLYQLTKDVLKTRHIGQIESEPGEVVLPDEFHPLSIPVDSPEYKNAKWYLKQRGVILEDIVRYNIGYCEAGEYEYHVIIPSYDADGKLNFFIGRRYYTEDRGIPYKKPDISMNIIGFESFINYSEPLILVESPFNMLTIRRNAISLFGKYPSQKLYEAMIINHVKKVYVFLDSDARKDAMDICQKLLNLRITSYFVNVVGGKDANEIGFKKSWECIKNSKEVDFSFLLKEKLNNNRNDEVREMNYK